MDRWRVPRNNCLLTNSQSQRSTGPVADLIVLRICMSVAMLGVAQSFYSWGSWISPPPTPLPRLAMPISKSAQTLVYICTCARIRTHTTISHLKSNPNTPPKSRIYLRVAKNTMKHASPYPGLERVVGPTGKIKVNTSSLLCPSQR